ncbi:MAG: hypothetical protein OEQ39_22410 [Gammaproteobacteria bacterium]|nr:hypothetical protein [Gammaproteobacteria bacterium]MDH3467477.1 hypothetical protein [Gammaproteobacteria bacterium]
MKKRIDHPTPLRLEQLNKSGDSLTELNSRIESGAELTNQDKKRVARIQEAERNVMAWAVRGHRVEYEQDGNPLHVWRTYQICREYRFPQPKWISDYMDKVARELLSIEKTRDNSKKQLLIALGAKSAKGFGQFNNYKIKRAAVLPSIDRKLRRYVGLVNSQTALIALAGSAKTDNGYPSSVNRECLSAPTHMNIGEEHYLMCETHKYAWHVDGEDIPLLMCESKENHSENELKLKECTKIEPVSSHVEV